MGKRLAENLIETNEEYTKLRSDRPDGEAPRDRAGASAPGARGLRREELDQRG